MIAHDIVSHPAALWALQFPSLRADARAYVFPCDERGNVPLDGLGRPALLDYFFARRMVGRTLASPRLIALTQH